MTNGRNIYYTLNKDSIIHNEPSPLQLCVGDKPWTPTGNVHIRFWFSERAAHWIWLECIDDIPSSCLVDELEGDFMYEWPLKDVVKLSTHHHKEQREVSALTKAVPHDVETSEGTSCSRIDQCRTGERRWMCISHSQHHLSSD